jgi:autotransporter adhesin
MNGRFDMAASTAAQVGATDIMTVDATGTVGRDATIRPAIAAIQTLNAEQDVRLGAIETVNTTQNSRLSAVETLNTVQGSQITALQAGQTTLNNLIQHNRKEARQGIAAAVALAPAAMPSEAGKTSYTANVATFRGEQAFGAALAHRFDGANPIALTVGVSHSGGKNTAARVGLSGEF